MTGTPESIASGSADDAASDGAVRVALGVLLVEAVAACDGCGVLDTGALCGLSDDDLLAGLVAAERLGRLVDGLRVRVAGEVAHRSRRELGSEGLAVSRNFPNATDLIAESTLVSRSTVRARIMLGERVRPSVVVGVPVPARFPEVEDALRSGLIGVDTADAITRPLSQVATTCGCEEVRAAERQLVEWAVDGVGGVALPADQIRGLASRVRETLDADGAEPRYADLEARRGLTLTLMRTGCVRVSGVLTPVQGAAWLAIDHAISSPRTTSRVTFHPDTPHPAGAPGGDASSADAHESTGRVTGAAEMRDHEHGDSDGDVAGGGEVVVDSRSVSQRRADTFTELMRAAAALPGMPHLNGAAPVVNVIATLDDVVSGKGVGWVPGLTEPVPASVVQQFLCHADITTTLLGEAGQVLSHGKTRRLFTAAQNKALAVRDGGCVWKGCDRPPPFCESHHVHEWGHHDSLRGRTDVDNGVLLCAFHHRHLHTTDWKLVMEHGVPHLIPPRWVDPDQRPQRCRQTRDRLTTTPPPTAAYRFDPQSRRASSTTTTTTEG